MKRPARKVLRENIIDILLKNHTYLSYGMLLHSSSIQGARSIADSLMEIINKYVTELKQEKSQ